MLDFLLYEICLEDISLKKKLLTLMTGLFLATMLSACGQDPAITKFKNEIDDFCTRISEIDTSINNIDAEEENSITLLLKYLDDLNKEFQSFTELDFPKDFDYLESVADEAGSYMAEAVKSYKDVYENGYNEVLAEYATENYSRAYKRIQVIIKCLQGESLEDVSVITNE